MNLTRATSYVLVGVAALTSTVACGGAPTSTNTSKTAAPDSAKSDSAKSAPGTGATAAQRECVAAASVGGDFPADAPKRISVQHLVVKHVDSKRAPDGVTRSRGEACMRAREALEKMKQGSDFAEVVAEYSDEAGAATRDGSLGEIRREDMIPEFAAAAFALDAGQVSYVVETKFGFHIIVRTD